MFLSPEDVTLVCSTLSFREGNTSVGLFSYTLSKKYP